VLIAAVNEKKGKDDDGLNEAAAQNGQPSKSNKVSGLLLTAPIKLPMKDAMTLFQMYSPTE
jgi:hypothetical protein